MSKFNKEEQIISSEEYSSRTEQDLSAYDELIKNVEYWKERTYHLYTSCIFGSIEIVFDNELGWCVDVDGDVNFYNMDIKELPFQFRNVTGDFDIENNRKLKSLKGCPVWVGGNFSCSDCINISSLEYCPKYIEEDFYCYNCKEKFTKEYIKSLCEVKRKIYNYYE